MITSKEIRRREVYWVDLDKTVGTEIRKIRPCLVISSDKQNSVGSRIIIIPLSSQPTKYNPLHVEVNLINKKKSYILPEQIRSVSKKRVKNYLGIVSKETMFIVSRLLHIILELEEN